MLSVIYHKFAAYCLHSGFLSKTIAFCIAFSFQIWTASLVTQKVHKYE